MSQQPDRGDKVVQFVDGDVCGYCRARYGALRIDLRYTLHVALDGCMARLVPRLAKFRRRSEFYLRTYVSAEPDKE